MFEIDSYKENQTCTLCDKEAVLIVSCKLGSMTKVPLCTKCLTRQCKARAASKPVPQNGQVHEFG
jgi:transcription elongation factor Elf1